MTTEQVILDFETTGIAPQDSRIIEVGAALVKDGKIVQTFSSLCNPGKRIPSFITGLTGITNSMLEGQPTPEEVMEEFSSFAGERPILAHNASFDGRFLRSEMQRIDRDVMNPMACTMLLSRRLIQDSPSHKLGVLKAYLGYEEEEGHHDHRALDDVKVTVTLWRHLQRLVSQMTGREDLPFQFYQTLCKTPKAKVNQLIEKVVYA